MLRLVSTGPRIIAVRTKEQEKIAAYFLEQFDCVVMEHMGMGIDPDKTRCIICVVDENGTAATAKYLGVYQPVEFILCQLMAAPVREDIAAVRALPPVVIFNGMGNVEAVMEKMLKEFPCEASGLDALLHRENNEGVLLVFLREDVSGQRKFHDKLLFVQEDYASLLKYLTIHAPRYLAKAFAPDAWHMVDIRMFDRYEAYEVQYKRLLEAIDILDLGYIVTETWDREVTAFADPLGTYRIRLMTFMKPIELKKLLVGLEYSQGGTRIVDLDLFWHGKKISWKDLLDDKETRKKIKKTADFFPKSNFFAVQSDRAELIKYCREATMTKIAEKEQEKFLNYEQEICCLAE